MKQHEKYEWYIWVLGIAFIVVIFLAIALAFWLVWTSVVPYYFPTGPEEVIRPDFWMFAGGMLLLKFVQGFIWKK